MSAYGLAGFDHWLQSPYDYENETSEAKESAIRDRIESDPSEAISDYFDDARVEMDGHDLLTEFTIALIGFDAITEKLFHGDCLTDDDNQALRALGRQIQVAKRLADEAVQEQVEREMS